MCKTLDLLVLKWNCTKIYWYPLNITFNTVVQFRTKEGTTCVFSYTKPPPLHKFKKWFENVNNRGGVSASCTSWWGRLGMSRQHTTGWAENEYEILFTVVIHQKPEKIKQLKSWLTKVALGQVVHLDGGA